MIREREKMIRNMINRVIGKLNKTARLEKSTMNAPQFNFGWNLLVKKFDLRMWFLQNSWNMSKRINYTRDLERLHYDLNHVSYQGENGFGLKDILFSLEF